MNIKKVTAVLLTGAMMSGGLIAPDYSIPQIIAPISASADTYYEDSKIYEDTTDDGLKYSVYGSYREDNNGEMYDITYNHAVITGYSSEELYANIIIPKSIDNIPVTEIGNHAFFKCNSLSSIIIPNSITSIGDNAFSSCKILSSIVFPNSIKNIGSSAFDSCLSLTSINIPDSVTSIGVGAFSRCENLSSITISDKITDIGFDAFYMTPWFDKKREENPLVIINNTVIDGELCTGNVIIPDGVKKITPNAFLRCDNQITIELPNSITCIDNYAFSSCENLISIKMPKSISHIGYAAFYGCKNLSSIIIPDDCEYIDYMAFDNCNNLTSIIVPNSVFEIYYYAFLFCEKLKDITIYNPKCVIYDNSISTTATIYGYVGSTAQEYAEEFDIKFVAIDDTTTTTPVTTTTTTTTTKPVTTTTTTKPITTTTTKPALTVTKKGDANCDGTADIADVVLAKCYLINPKAYSITEQGLANADVIGSGNGLEIQDVVAIQKLVLKLISSDDL